MATATTGIVQPNMQGARCTIVELAGREALPMLASGATQTINWCFGPRTFSLCKENDEVPFNAVPDGWWQAACEQTHMPIACVDRDNMFVWVNSAFERLVGYSCAELVTKTWMDITDQRDVGGDLASSEQLKSGNMMQYSLAKHYIHKRGYKVPIELSVTRFPVNGMDDLRCFIAEAAPEVISKVQLQAMEENMNRTISELAERLERYERGVQVNVGDHWRDGDNIRGDKNSDKMIKYIVGAVVAVAAFASYAMYYIAISTNQNGLNAPQAPTKLENPIK